MWLIPGILQTQWHISTETHQPRGRAEWRAHDPRALTNTNDGEISAPTAVPEMSLSVAPREGSRSPPSSVAC